MKTFKETKRKKAVIKYRLKLLVLLGLFCINAICIYISEHIYLVYMFIFYGIVIVYLIVVMKHPTHYTNINKL